MKPRALFGRALGRVRAARHDLLLAAFAGIAGVAGSYAVTGFTPAFVASPVERELARRMPGAVVSAAIQYLGSLGQQLNLLTAVALTVTLFGALAYGGLRAGRSLRNRAAPGILAAGATWAATAVLTETLVVALGAGIPVGAALFVAELVPLLDPGGSRARSGDDTAAANGGIDPATGAETGPDETPGARTADEANEGDGGALDETGDPWGTDDDAGRTGPGRREVLASALSVVGFAGAATVIGARRTPGIRGELRGGEGGGPTGLLADADDRSLGVDSLEPLVSEDFYEVDINAVNPSVDVEDWSLSVTGAVENEFEVTRDELQAMPTQHRFVTLRCVGESLNGKKMDTALWTGTPVAGLLDRANPQSGCECVMLRGADDYYEEFPIEALWPGLLAYGMNGDVLPRGHGYPVRALVPGHWGEVNLKWLDEIEVLEREAEGYWEKKGWQGTGPVNTVAKLHAVNRGDGRIEVGGHAYAGTRGISRVEVSTDGGDTWTDAELSEPLPAAVEAGTAGTTPTGGSTTATPTPDSPTQGAADAWRQWRHEYDDPGTHQVVVRAVDGTGTVQTSDESGSFPSGATGWVSRQLG